MNLDWGEEYIRTGNDEASWNQAGSNLVLDFHGDPVNAELIIFSDGNHHMALLDAVNRFQALHKLKDIFYTTTPPGPLVAALGAGGLRLGNLMLSCRPDVFISPRRFLDALEGEELVSQPEFLFRSRGNVLLVKKGNPNAIQMTSEIARSDIKIFISNPDTEKASFTAYNETLSLLGLPFEKGNMLVGEKIHHREAPQAVADGRADCAILYYHLALRYVRKFPDQFEMIEPGKSNINEASAANDAISSSFISLVGDGGAYGKRFMEFMLSDEVAEMYRYHGMDHDGSTGSSKG